ncbi:hypothetical protein DDB_G0282053 [Dictyostelium discoideum AX4]|uniref:Uncharacterized protein n=1 Tax=Dictyostelium discoideum TaxID=44689 RepID=Q54T14_DICDI|nr:hypothetical protein DDB_G0282053 [Dictyostelium discoideum AX4]EAL66448.1 hypothetical protein DDB_G0282053 [Dictyostelium discoideum AX4]|eukprot:XP_640437.1 hypothetical protein DDB_G0282053 [Dictyostelium discoideum AX4]
MKLGSLNNSPVTHLEPSYIKKTTTVKYNSNKVIILIKYVINPKIEKKITILIGQLETKWSQIEFAEFSKIIIQPHFLKKNKKNNKNYKKKIIYQKISLVVVYFSMTP